MRPGADAGITMRGMVTSVAAVDDPAFLADLQEALT